MESMFMDQSPLNPSNINRHGGLPYKSNNITSSTYASYSPYSSGTLFSNVGLYGPRPLPPIYSSLPSLTPPQRPLLPLPFSESPNKKTFAAAARSGEQWHSQHRKPKAGSKPRKDGKCDTPALALKRVEAAGKEEIVYSISPPPSSLPLPKFSLTRPKATAGSGSGEAVHRASGISVVDAGATDDLRRILRL